MDLSIVIPLYNESESIVELNSSINNVLSNSKIILIQIGNLIEMHNKK